MAWVSDFIHMKIYHVISHPSPNFNGLVVMHEMVSLYHKIPVTLQLDVATRDLLVRNIDYICEDVKVFTSIVKGVEELLIVSQTSRVPQLTFWNRQAISSHTFLDMWLLIHSHSGQWEARVGWMKMYNISCEICTLFWRALRCPVHIIFVGKST